MDIFTGEEENDDICELCGESADECTCDFDDDDDEEEYGHGEE